MPDDLKHVPRAPRSWSDAFAALPLEQAPADGWERLRERMSIAQRRSRPEFMRGLRPWSAAAALAAVALASVLFLRGHAPVEHPFKDPVFATTVEPHGTAGSADIVASARTTARPASVASPRPAGQSDEHGRASPVDTVSARRAPAASGAVRIGSTTRRPTPVLADPNPRGLAGHPSVRPTETEPPNTTVSPPLQVDEVASVRLAAAALGGERPASVADATDVSLAALQSESRRLEALVASARDERMASATAAVLTASVDERIGVIDGALSQPQLDGGDRLELWRQRVAALQELAGLEGTRRWLAVHGQSLDGALTRVD